MNISPQTSLSVLAASGPSPVLRWVHNAVFGLTIAAMLGAAGLLALGTVSGSAGIPAWTVVVCLWASLLGLGALFVFRFVFELD